MGDIWQAARANNVKRVKALLDQGTSPDATRWVRGESVYISAWFFMFQSVEVEHEPPGMPPTE